MNNCKDHTDHHRGHCFSPGESKISGYERNWNKLPNSPKLSFMTGNSLDNVGHSFPLFVDFKVFPTIHPEPLTRPFHGLGCGCMPHSKGSVAGTTMKLGLRNLLTVPTNSAKNHVLTRHCAYIFYCVRIKVPSNYPILTSKAVLGDDKVREAIEKQVLEEMEERSVGETKGGPLYLSLVAKYHQRAVATLCNMKADLSSALIRVVGYILFKVFNHLFMSVTVNEGQMEMLNEAAVRNIPIIFLPLHRSHADYLFVTWCLFNREISAPLVAAGNNLNLPIFGWLLRGLGGFFIKRTLERSKTRKDYVYRAVLQSYVSRALRSGCNIEFFIEGGRTRTGKPCIPKGGLLSVVVDSFLSGSMDDALIVPIAINYDKIVDGNFVREQLGRKKVPESFWRAITAIAKVLSTNYGHSRLDFGQPFSLREFFQSSSASLRDSLMSEAKDSLISRNSNGMIATHHRSLSSPVAVTSNSLIADHGQGFLHPTWSNSSLVSETSEEYRCFVRNLATHIVYDAERCQAIMATNIVAWILSVIYREGILLDRLTLSVADLIEDLRTKNRDVGFSGDPLHVSIHAITMLGSSLVSVKGDLRTDDPSEVFVQPVTELPNIVELNYYANALAPFYAMDGIVGTCLLKMSECNLTSYCNVDMETSILERELLENCTKLCNFLRNEFLFAPPCGDVESKVRDSIDRFIVSGLLRVEGKYHQHRYRDDDIDEEDDEEENSPWRHDRTSYVLCPSDENLRRLSMVTSALAPLIESYHSTAQKLDSLLISPCEDREFVNNVQSSIRSKFLQGTLTYGECIAADPIRNAMKVFECDGILESYLQDSCRIVFLSKEFECERRLRTLQEEISSFRVRLL